MHIILHISCSMLQIKEPVFILVFLQVRKKTFLPSPLPSFLSSSLSLSLSLFLFLLLLLFSCKDRVRDEVFFHLQQMISTSQAWVIAEIRNPALHLGLHHGRQGCSNHCCLRCLSRELDRKKNLRLESAFQYGMPAL